jgi:N-succinyldiaminopimelate aminotransferase
MNPDLAQLHPYPFEQLAALKSGITPPAALPHIAWSIGEPKHAAPAFVAELMLQALDSGLSQYPPTKGSSELRAAMAGWATQRYHLAAARGALDPERHVLPVNGTREALFAFAQCIVDRADRPLVLMPNPFYQIYEGAALLAGAEPYYLNCTQETGLLPDLDAVPETVWQRCQLFYLCSPGNPSGRVMPPAMLRDLIEKAERYDFVLAADECYSEIYFDDARPPPGLLQICAETGRNDFRRCVVFNSLSKRSNLPGLRSGFVAGDADIIRSFLLYRTYHGGAMPPITQNVSTFVWQDEDHVRTNRELYRRKFAAVLEILAPVMTLSLPDAGFFLWPQIEIDDTIFARQLFARQNITVLPGSFLSREMNGRNPGSGYVRMAQVAPFDECVEAARRIRDFIASL